jgi:hypothetical protein
MADFILIDGDKAIFLPTFGAAIVSVKPGELKASGKPTLSGSKICLEGDESSVEVAGCNYVAGGFTGGVGTLKISALDASQVAQKTKKCAAVMLKGGMFVAEFKVTTPGQLPPPASTADPAPMYSGKGSFENANMKWKAT